jgi:Tol biopolymer transport system component
MSNTPPSVIGPYQLLGQLGAGGMGEVYRALDTRVGRHVALKILPESMAQDSDRRRRFEQEARLAASLNHPNVMAIYDVGLDQHPPYIVSELVPGESLRAFIEKGPLAVRKAVDVAAQIAAGLAAAHSAGIVHRDLKPENVMVTPEGSAKILDFGVARMETRAATAGETVTLANTSVGSVIGTAAYMSPEQARAEDVDYRSDQFALGLVLYEMLTGKAAFERASAVQTMSAIIQDDAPPIERPAPIQLRWIVERCLAKERTGRYESTRDLARELAHLRDHFGEVSSGTGQQLAVAPAAGRPVRRARLWFVAIAALAGAAIAWCAAILRDSGAVDLAQYNLTPFATALAEQGLPSWSQDGKSIAFFGSAEGQPTQLWVQALDGATAVAVTKRGANVSGVFPPVWSPDSRSLYIRCGVRNEAAICRVPAGGGEPVVVQEQAMFATLSRDGRTLVTLGYVGDAVRPVLFVASPPDGPRRPYEPEPSFEGRQYYNNPSLAFAPDGSKILFSIALEGRGELSWELPWPQGKARPVFAEGSVFAFTPQASWLPDSRHFVFAGSRSSKSSQLYMAEIGSGRYWPVLAQDRGVSFPGVSPDGTHVAYQSNLSHSDVIAAPIGDGPVRTLISSLRSEQMADASPMAPQLVYVTNRRGPLEIWLSSFADNRADDWDRPLITPNDLIVDGEPAQFFMDPVFSPDGRRIAFVAKIRSGVVIYTAFTSGGAPVRATSEKGVLESAPAWSADGNWLVFERETATSLTLAKVQPGSGIPPVDIGPMAGRAMPAWSPSGEWIAYHDSNGLLLISPDGKQPRRLPGDFGPVAWSRDSKTLYHIHARPPALMAIDAVTGKDRKIRDLEGLEPYSGLNPGLRASLTSDGKYIVYGVNHPRTEIWILDGLQTPKPWYLRLLGR